MNPATLHGRLAATAERFADRVAAVDTFGNSLTYEQLDLLSSRIASALVARGVGPRDRVAICLPKSVDAVATIYGVLKLGACYVPLDVRVPATRNALIVRDCGVRAAVLDPRRADELRDALGDETPPLLVDPDPAKTNADDWLRGCGTDRPRTDVGADDLAYLLYTSGTTGRPKGVMLTHGNALAFVDWCVEILAPTPDDRFSAHAGFNFDLSIHDLFVPAACGASVVVIGEDVALHPRRLAPVIAEQRITIWYSVPSALVLLMDHGDLAHHDFSQLRVVSTAGEVFAVPKLRALTEIWPHPRYLNLYGPTETNVCTFFEIRPPVPPDRREPYPIGRACSGAKTRVVGSDGQDVPRGTEGELLVAGPSVTSGYWNRPERNATAFAVDRFGSWYRTGDIVVETEADGYVFRGRRDRMVKRRGYRVELGDVEAALHRHPGVREAAVIAVHDADGSVLLRAFVVAADAPLSSIALRELCAKELPVYMIPDELMTCAELPRTSTGKVDLQALHETSRAS